jgi:peptidoglycan/xylan/chitin deacetylase (PgdA/CDA1 family)
MQDSILKNSAPEITRRGFLAATGAGLLSGASARVATCSDGEDKPAKKALVAITLDLEMSRNFPTWEQTHWDYEKGNLNPETKRYAVEAARRVKARGGVIHFFVVGRTLEQENIDWLREIRREGHPIGNHTYDHVNVKATRLEDIQFRFKRAPWLIAGESCSRVIQENIRLTSSALKSRIGAPPSGFRTPGGFSDGLADRPDVQKWLLDLGFRWVSSKYPTHLVAGPKPSQEALENIVRAQAAAQPFVYPSGLVEVPMSPISDIGSFRTGRWKLESFLNAIRMAVEWVIDRGNVFDFLGHPSCLYVTDPEFQTIDLICDLVKRAGPGGSLVSLDQIAARFQRSP